MTMQFLLNQEHHIPDGSREAVETAIDRAKGDRDITWEKAIRRSRQIVPIWDAAEEKDDDADAEKSE